MSHYETDYEAGPEDTDAFDDFAPAKVGPVSPSVVKINAVRTNFVESALASDFAEFPAELKEKRVWCLWKYGYRDGKKTKIPYRDLVFKARSDDPKTWISFDTAVSNLLIYPGQISGIGCFVHEGYGFSFFDIDDCRDPESGTIEPWATEIIAELDTYTELSPSGTGVHVYLRGAVPDAAKINGCEIYSKNTFFTVTGERLPGVPSEIKAFDRLADLRERIANNKLRPYQLQKNDATHAESAQAKKPGLIVYAPVDLDELLQGRWENRYASQSEADLAAWNLLLRKYDGDTEKADEVFRASALMRDKWDEHRGAKTYGEKTIALALKSYKEWKALPPETNTVPERGPQCPQDCLEGDAISDFMHAVTDRTGIPPQFARAAMKAAISLAADFRIGYPAHENIHMRPYLINVSDVPRTGKGESFERAFGMNGLAKDLLRGIFVIEGTTVGSGQYAVKKLADCRAEFDKTLNTRDGVLRDNTPDAIADEDVAFSGKFEVTGWADVIRILKEKGLPVESEEIKKLKLAPTDERLERARERDYATAKRVREQEVVAMAAFVAKNPSQRTPRPTDDYLRTIFRHDELANAYKNENMSMEELLLTTYERTIAAHGSFLNGERTVENVCVELIADTSERGFASLYTGRISALSGFLPRCTIEYGTKKYLEEWEEMNVPKALAAAKELGARLARLPKSTIAKSQRFVPQETVEAAELRREFLRWLSQQNPNLIPELDTHFRRDVLIRVVASGAERIEIAHVRRAILWTKYQLAVREYLYPQDQETAVGRLEGGILRLLDKHAPKALSDRDLTQALHVGERNRGSYDDYNRARQQRDC